MKNLILILSILFGSCNNMPYEQIHNIEVIKKIKIEYNGNVYPDAYYYTNHNSHWYHGKEGEYKLGDTIRICK